VPQNGFLLRFKCAKFSFGWGSLPDPMAVFTVLPQTVWL